MEDIPDVVSVRKFREFSAEQKEELFDTLCNLSEAIKDIPKKSLRKTLEVTFAILKYKGEQVNGLSTQLADKRQKDSQDEIQYERLLDENDKLKQMLEKLEDEKTESQQKVKELTDDLLQQQRRLQEALNTAEISDKDSSDPLSELDKQEELLRNISRKNKHIKRLLKEIESLQNQNIAQSKAIIQLEKELQGEKSKVLKLKDDIGKLDGQRKSLKDSVNELNTEIARLEGNITYLEEERENSERDLKNFIEKLEIKAQSWKNLLDEKDRELNRLRGRSGVEGAEGTNSEQQSRTFTVNENGISETMKLMGAIELRDRQIEQLELKLKSMAEEMLTTTHLMNKLSNEREEEKNPRNPRACCKLIEQSLEAANKRCREISEMLERSEEDNAIKSKQALQALNALDAYQRGEDGLTKALRKCTTLEQKILSRDKQIRALVMQLNSMHEIANENSILRKRLNIPDDVIIATKNLAAKERSKDKMIDRLTLKLRASEEMRLQLKLEKVQLKKQILTAQSQKETFVESPEESRLLSEIGEVSDSVNMKAPAVTDDQVLCSHCNLKAKESQIEKFCEITTKPVLTDLHAKYQEVLEENETLRVGMHEILEKLRDYDALSDHITIDTEILHRLLQALQVQSAPQTPKRLEMEVRALQAREEALRLQMQAQDSTVTDSIETDELTSIGSVRFNSGDPNEKSSAQSPIVDERLPTSRSQKFPKEKTVSYSPTSVQSLHETRTLHQQIDELNVYRKRYEELQLHMRDPKEDMTRFIAELEEKACHTELELVKLRSCYNFMREDFDRTLTESQQSQLKHIQIVAQMKTDLNAKGLEIADLIKERDQLKSTQLYSIDEYESVLKSKAELQAQIAFIVEHIFSGKIAAEYQIKDICADYGVIEENLQLNFITIEELETRQGSHLSAKQQHNEEQRKVTQLEGLLEIAQDQIQSQQRLLNEITDNHIDLRHLVADLQSKSEEKHLMAKLQRELNCAKAKQANLEIENDELNKKCIIFKSELTAERQKITEIQNDFRNECAKKDTKIKFLLLSLYNLKEKYAKFTPLIFLTNFVFAYTRFSKKALESSRAEGVPHKLQEIFNTKANEPQSPASESTTLTKLIKAEAQCKLVKENLLSLESKCESLQQEVMEQRIRFATETAHWHAIEVLCAEETPAPHIQRREVETNTDTPPSAPAPIPAERKLSANVLKRVELIDKCSSPIASPTKSDQKTKRTNISTQTSLERMQEQEQCIVKQNEAATTRDNCTTEAGMQTVAKSMENQEVQTVDVGSVNATQSETKEETSTLDETENKQILTKMQTELSNANKRVEELQNLLDMKTATKGKEKSNISTEPSPENGIIEKTILSLNTLLVDKDKSISKYQDLLQNEREHNNGLTSKLNSEVDGLRSTVSNLNFNIKAKDLEILELKTKLEAISIRHNSNEKLDLAVAADENGDNSLNELTDEKIEEMFQQDALQPSPTADQTAAPKIEQQDSVNEISLKKQINDLEEKIKYAESTITIKEDEITLLKEKVKLYQEREKSLENMQAPQLEKLRALIEDKDKHINDLMDTLKNFHDDQQSFIKDSSSYSEDQITKLSSDLMRTEATNKIYQTQVEALRRQLTNLTQREKQARELNQSLRNQLIKRPVVSIKTELNTRVKTENMQKRIHQLELELEDARAQIQRQLVIIETKRAKSASEVGLWEKQKRWQQNAEKFKAKLEETECMLEKTRTLLQSARNTITRLEKDKQVLEVKLGRATATQGVGNQSRVKCCRTPSCPNLNGVRNSMTGKYTPSESPETYTGGSSDYSSPSHSVCEGTALNASIDGRTPARRPEHNQSSLIEALKARIEMQQRKILAMELEGKGTNALTCEMEKLQEKLSAIEAQNIRLEAKNLQLQLDNDLLRQNDVTDRLQKRIKHLEDYIIALKEELAQSQSQRVVCKCSGIKITTQQGHSADQTILSLRNLVEKLRAENKYLKDGRRSSDPRCSIENMPSDLSRIQQLYAESLDKVAALQLELSLKAKCVNCMNKGKTPYDSPVNAELKFIKEQLVKKTQLLQKAKVLLTRAAAKEKILKEQLALWKRKCSELQNVPVIDEISE